MGVSQFKIQDYLERLRPKIDKRIEKYLPRKVSKEWLEDLLGREKFCFSPNAIQKAILDPIWNFLDRGGKRWRPGLFLLTLEAFGKNPKKFEDFAIIPEILHSGSLIIDDIEDQGELRRGKPCLHKIFGLDIALNAGNFLYFFPLYVFKKNKRKLKKDVYFEAISALFDEMIKLHLGQGTDIFWHRGGEEKITENEYLQMCANKTGSMARFSAKLGAILAEKEKSVIENLGNFGESLGIAFQIQDDILDVTLTGEEREKFGKAFGNDIKEGKMSLIVIYALKKVRKKERKRLIEILKKHTDDPKEKIEAILIIEKSGAIEYAKRKAREIVKNAWEKVKSFFPDSKAKIKLKELSQFLIERKI